MSEDGGVRAGSRTITGVGTALTRLALVGVLGVLAGCSAAGPLAGGGPTAVAPGIDPGSTSVEPATDDAEVPEVGEESDVPEVERPHILLITTDDQADTDLRHMPRTRRLISRRGINFTRAISPHPLCCPARALLMTGQLAHNNGVEHNEGPFGGYGRFESAHEGRNLRQNIGTWLQRAGYRTGLIGKTMNEYKVTSVRPEGWDLWDPTADRTYAFYGTQFLNNGDPETPPGYVADVVAERAVRFIEEQTAAAAPFFLWVSHVAPHEGTVDGRFVGHPLPAERHRDLFASEVPPSLDKPSFGEPDLSDKPVYNRRGRGWDPELLTFQHRERLRSLAAVDEANAQVIRALRRAGAWEDTVVVFTSDNGYLMGEHRVRGKNFVYQENLQVPLLMSGPGIRAGSTSTQLATLLDIPATVLDAASALTGRAARMVDGVSLLPTARGQEGASLPRTVLIQAGTTRPEALGEENGWLFRGVYSERYTYAEHFTGERELYDRRRDPYELENILARPRPPRAYAGVVDELADRLRTLKECRGARQCARDLGPPPRPAS